jgi:hypothetical protein
MKIRLGLIGFACFLLINCGGSGGQSGGSVSQIGGTIADPEPRSFSLGFTPFPHAFTQEAVDDAYDVIKRNADMIVQHFDDGVPWQEALDNANNAKKYRDTYAGNFLNDLDYKLQHNPAGHVVYLALTPLGPLREGLALHRGNSVNEPLTTPWDTYALDHPEVIKAYTRHCLNMIEHFDPDYVAYAIEANMLAYFDKQNGTNKWSQFVNLVKKVYPAIKAKHPDLPLFISLQVGFFHSDPGQQAMDISRILPYTDYIAISAYPYTETPDPADLPADYFSELIELAPTKPVVIAETAWPAEDVEDVKNPGTIIAAEDPQRQQQYIQRLIGEMDKLDCRFITIFFTRDYDDFWESDFQYYPNAQLIRTWRDTGLYDGQGNPRPALDTWLAALKRPKS